MKGSPIYEKVGYKLDAFSLISAQTPLPIQTKSFVFSVRYHGTRVLIGNAMKGCTFRKWHLLVIVMAAVLPQ